MKKITLALLITFLFVLIGHCQEQPIKFTIRSFSGNTIEAGNAGITIVIIFQNMSDKPIALARDYNRYDFKFFDANGRPLPSEKPNYPSYVATTPIKLLPGAEYIDYIPANDWKVDGSSIDPRASKPRKILIQGVYEGPTKDKKFEGVDIFKGNLISNTIPFEIVLPMPAIYKELNEAVQHNNIKKIDELISKGADINAGFCCDCYEKPLHYATEPDIGLVTYLAQGGNIPLGGNYRIGGTSAGFLKPGCLSYSKSVETAKLRTVKFLVSKGADVNGKDSSSNTPLMNAAAYNGLEIAKFLLESGADVNAKNLAGFTALHTAVVFNNIKMVKLLISKGAGIDIAGIDGTTPLMDATKYGYTEIAKLLAAKNK